MARRDEVVRKIAAGAEIIGLLLVASAASAAEKKAEPKTYPTSRTFAASCDAVWPQTVKAAMSQGWSIKASDKGGGVLTLENGTQLTGGNRNSLVGKYTIEKSTGIWTFYKGFRTPSGQVILSADGPGCMVIVSVQHQGYESRLAGGENWWILRSNGFMESELLDKIAASLSPQSAPEGTPPTGK